MPRDRPLRRSVVVALSAAVLVWAGPAVALKDKRDAKAMFSALNDLMQFAAPGRSVVWENPDTGNSGDITAKRRDDRDGRICWAYERTYVDVGATQMIKGTACEIVPGLWEIVTESMPEARTAAPEPLTPAPDPDTGPTQTAVPPDPAQPETKPPSETVTPAPDTAQPDTVTAPEAPQPDTATGPNAAQPDTATVPEPVAPPADPPAELAVATAEPGPEPAAEPSPAETRPIYDRAEVRETQRLLANLGYDPGPVDGAYGARTKRAIIAFQRDAGLPQTGEPSTALLTRLRESNRTGSVIEASTPGADETDGDTTPAGTVPGGADDEPWLAPTSMPTPSSSFVPSTDSGAAASGNELIVPPPPPPPQPE